MSASQIEIIQAYRSLYKSFLKAVRYAKPARYIVHERIRDAFSSSPATDFDQSRIQRTLEFANGAARTSGLEHTILKNLVHVHWGREEGQRKVYARTLNKRNDHVTWAKIQADAEFDRTVQMLNETMGLCIK